MAKRGSKDEAAMRLRHPEARSCSYDGRVFTADEDGVVTVPIEAVAALKDHGFVPVDEGAE